MRKGLVVTSPEMEVEVARLTPVKSVLQILAGKLQAQFLVYVPAKAKISQYFEYDQTQKINNKTTPHNNRPKRLLLIS